MKEYLDSVAYICDSDIPDDDGQIYRSREDHSYISRVGLEDCGTLRFLKEHDVKKLQTNNGNTACMGFSNSEQKWYGWSHRAIYGFEIGSEIKKGDCAYHPTDNDDFLQDMIRFWSDEDRINITGEHAVDGGESGVRISWTCSDKIPNERMRGCITRSFQVYPDSWGKGEWSAKTLDDAKTMAADFAEGVG